MSEPSLLELLFHALAAQGGQQPRMGTASMPPAQVFPGGDSIVYDPKMMTALGSAASMYGSPSIYGLPGAEQAPAPGIAQLGSQPFPQRVQSLMGMLGPYARLAGMFSGAGPLYRSALSGGP